MHLEIRNFKCLLKTSEFTERMNLGDFPGLWLWPLTSVYGCTSPSLDCSRDGTGFCFFNAVYKCLKQNLTHSEYSINVCCIHFEITTGTRTSS